MTPKVTPDKPEEPDQHEPNKSSQDESEPKKKKGLISKAKGWWNKKKSESDSEGNRKKSSSGKKKKGYLERAKGALSKGKKKAQKAAGFEKDEDDLDLGACFPSMSYKTRLKGFGIAFGLGVILNILAAFIFWMSAGLQMALFAIFYSLGNICILGSGVFLTGIKRQFKMIMSYGRYICLAIYLGIMIFTLWYILFRTKPDTDSDSNELLDPETGEPLTVPVRPNFLIIICLVVAQFLAGLWYMLSFIPYGRALAKKCCMRCAAAE